MSFNTKTKTQEWMTFLDTMRQVPLSVGHEISICQQLPMYKSAESRRLDIRSAKGIGEEKLESGEWTLERHDAEIANWSLGIAIGTYLPLIWSYGTLIILTNALGNASEQQSSAIADWHVYAAYFHQGILGIYDPSFTHESRTLDQSDKSDNS
ncbi:hypothetical protein B9Z19DRAFT_1119320 [Tuber borchii]|uniref:Uncharacterized protein n=1 Tax=Tuber borchii TaxID=42251 RepID=A0A2T7A6L6_TUBBO|nr:hypothetical protein B9Z19DRAFT_1119320 [Tuber borchii]